jgi:hypothetical protein
MGASNEKPETRFVTFSVTIEVLGDPVGFPYPT